MVDSVECRGQVRVQRPHPLGPRASTGHVDRLDGVLAAAARSKPVRLGFEPSFPFGLQRVTDPALMASVRDHGNTERPQLRTVTCLRYVHPPDRQESRWECTCTASIILVGEVSATSPSIPAVERPALRCVTCRTLTSVFDQDRNINFCRFLAVARSPSCVALKIRCRSRRTLSSWERHLMASHFGFASSGPFTPRPAIATAKA